MDLRKALRLAPDAQMAIVGAGGKTTAMFQIARAFGTPVVIAASTHLGVWQAKFADRHLIVTHPDDIEGSTGQIEGVTLISGPAGEDDRLGGLDAEMLDALHRLARRLGFPLLIEADGARQKPLKAPAEHEPAIPEWVDLVVVTAGLSAIGKPLDESNVHRPEQFARLSGLAAGAEISLDSLVKVLVHPEGGCKGIPDGARRIVLLNQAEDAALADAAGQSARRLIPPYDAVVVASLAEQRIIRVVEPVSAVILAAGGSTRFGQPKITLPWRGKPLVRIAAEAALGGGADEVVVVTGSAEGPVRAALEGLAVRIVHNPDWEAGQSTTVRAGLTAAAPEAGAAIFLLSDQPFITSELIRALINQHQLTLAPVIAPVIGGRRANPVLFDRETFAALGELEGDTGGRAIFHAFPVEALAWEDEAVLLDIDTPEDYRRLMEEDGS